MKICSPEKTVLNREAVLNQTLTCNIGGEEVKTTVQLCLRDCKKSYGCALVEEALRSHGVGGDHAMDLRREECSKRFSSPMKPPHRAGIRSIDIADIRIDLSPYPREKVIEENVKYLEGLDGHFKDPIIISYIKVRENIENEDGTVTEKVTRVPVVVDGMHRLEALRRKGVKSIDVEVYEYESNEALLAHAVELNCCHGRQLSSEEKKTWVRGIWSLNVGAEWLSRTVGMSTRTIQDWTSDLREVALKERNEAIRTSIVGGAKREEVAREFGVSESTVKRAVQKHETAEMVPAPQEEKEPVGDKQEAHLEEIFPEKVQREEEPRITTEYGAELLGTAKNGLDSLQLALHLYRNKLAPPLSEEDLKALLRNLRTICTRWETATKESTGADSPE